MFITATADWNSTSRLTEDFVDLIWTRTYPGSKVSGLARKDSIIWPFSVPIQSSARPYVP